MITLEVICVSALSRGVLDMRILRKPAHELVAWMVIGGVSAAAGKALARVHKQRFQAKAARCAAERH